MCRESRDGNIQSPNLIKEIQFISRLSLVLNPWSQLNFTAHRVIQFHPHTYFFSALFIRSRISLWCVRLDISNKEEKEEIFFSGYQISFRASKHSFTFIFYVVKALKEFSSFMNMKNICFHSKIFYSLKSQLATSFSTQLILIYRREKCPLSGVETHRMRRNLQFFTCHARVNGF